CSFISLSMYQNTCSQLHSKLAEPMTIEEARFLISYSHTLGHSYWLGISDHVLEGRWEYSSTQTAIKFDMFFPGQPTTGTSENCMIKWYPHGNEWGDEVCSYSYHFVCEQDQTGPANVIG
ncbi:perlucin-like, partial [Saccostrea cucullata]|uniref:perlucin-like n=1 Tax=Saccostrea cuccullata TaxID=36930 RepID=UPI002ED16C19